MKAGRPKRISGPIGWAAVIALVVWLGAISTTTSSHPSCCKSELARRTTPRRCCPGNEPCGKFTGCDPRAPQEIPNPKAVSPNDLLTGVPPNEPGFAFRVPPPIAVANRFLSTAIEPSIPAELRLGSALWSHAPPSHAA